jgi:parallel beta-helix repeat protein
MINCREVTVALILVLLCSTTLGSVCLQPVKAQYQGDLIINADGTVTPSSAPILQSGNMYSLTSDINGTITVNRSNVVLDGNKHTIDVKSIFDIGITLNDTTNSTIINFSVVGGQFGISVYGTSNVVSDNTVSSVNNGIYSLDEPTGGIALSGTSNSIYRNTLQGNLVGINFFGGLPLLNCSFNLIVGNTFTDCSTAVLLYDSSNNTFYHNNLINNENDVHDSGLGNYPQVISINTWDNGYPSGGNYWSDYKTKYPNAKEIDSTGIEDTPYAVDSNNMDHYPLTKPATASIPEFPSLIILVPVTIAASLALLYFKKRKH